MAEMIGNRLPTAGRQVWLPSPGPLLWIAFLRSPRLDQVVLDLIERPRAM